ncbi:MAG: HD domain-containing protein [Patescibacteria group bacterium]
MAPHPQINTSIISPYVTHVTKTLEKAGFETFLVGGCVRDLFMNRIPKDWDVTTNAKPEEIVPLFEKTVYENKFGTVGVFIPKEVTYETGQSVTRLTDGQAQETVQYNVVEITPYRIEGKYSDFRHPDEVRFSETIDEDLKRRDFTINAMAYNPNKGPASVSLRTGRQEGEQYKGHLIDLFNGLKDIKDKIIRAVGNANDRFNEDALRMMRAIRFSAQLNFTISSDTISALVDNSQLLQNISSERVRDEFTKIILSDNPVIGVGMLSKLGLLKYIIPELEEGIGCEQKGEHIYDVWEHLLHALGHAADKKWSLEVRLAALFHDIGKPRTRRWDGSKAGGKGKYTFYGHEVIGARMARQIMERLKYPRKTIELVVKLVRNHMFFSDTEQITLSAVRRIVSRVGEDHIWELMQIRECDRVGMKKKEAPYRLRKYHAMIEEVLRSPISVGQLAINGEVMIKELGIKPGPRMGWILHALLEEVLNEPEKNKREYLDDRVKELDDLSDSALKDLGEKGKEIKEELEEEEIEKLHKKHGVK